jgi:hypothetical protein
LFHQKLNRREEACLAESGVVSTELDQIGLLSEKEGR